jgi:Ala-tRNA(Pro) deacylase
MLLWDKKDKTKIWLVSADVNLTIGTKDIAKIVGVKPDNFRFAEGDVLGSILGCRQGTTNMFALLNDKERKVKYLLDSKLFNAEWASFHPMDNAASTVVN